MIVQLFAGIGILFFTALYQGCLLTRLLINPIPNYVDTIDELTNAIDRNHYKLIVATYAISEEYIQTTVGGKFDRLRETLKHNPKIHANGTDSILQNVRSLPGIYLSTDYNEVMTIAQNVSNRAHIRRMNCSSYSNAIYM